MCVYLTNELVLLKGLFDNSLSELLVVYIFSSFMKILNLSSACGFGQNSSFLVDLDKCFYLWKPRLLILM